MTKSPDLPQKGSNLITTREDNLSLVIKLIHKAGICSRADIAFATGLKQATITNIVNYLMDWGLVKETGSIEGRLKRRSIGITLNRERYRLLGVRLSRDNITVGVFDMANHLLEKKTEPFSSSLPPHAVVDKMIAMLKSVSSTIQQGEILGIGVALPGPFMAKEGRIALMSGFVGWELIDIQGRLRTAFSLPVFLEHDANCAALAEWWYSNAGEKDCMLLMQLDDGVGSAIIADGQLYRGSTGTAGEIGHSCIDYDGPQCQCGNRGCLELYCSTLALCQQYKGEYAQGDAVGNQAAQEIIAAVRRREPKALSAFTKTATFLSYGLVNAVNILNPEIVVLSGTLSLAGDALLDVVRPVLKERLIKDVYRTLDVRIGNFGEDNVLSGTGALVLEETLRFPTRYFNPNS